MFDFSVSTGVSWGYLYFFHTRLGKVSFTSGDCSDFLDTADVKAFLSIPWKWPQQKSEKNVEVPQKVASTWRSINQKWIEINMPRWKNIAPHLYNKLCTGRQGWIFLKNHSLDILLIAGGGTTCLILSVFFSLIEQLLSLFEVAICV